MKNDLSSHVFLLAAALCLASCATDNADTVSAAQLARIDRMSNRRTPPPGQKVVYTVEEIHYPNGTQTTESAELILKDRQNPNNPRLRIPYNPDNNTLPFNPMPGQDVSLYLDNQEGELRALFP